MVVLKELQKMHHIYGKYKRGETRENYDYVTVSTEVKFSF